MLVTKNPSRRKGPAAHLRTRHGLAERRLGPPLARWIDSRPRVTVGHDDRLRRERSSTQLERFGVQEHTDRVVARRIGLLMYVIVSHAMMLL